METEDEEEDLVEEPSDSGEENLTVHPSTASVKSMPSKIVLTPELIAEEKSHVIFEDDTKTSRRTSKFWSAYHIVESIDLVADNRNYPSLEKLEKQMKSPNCIFAVCKLCFQEPTKSL